MPAQSDPASASDPVLIRDRAIALLARREHGRIELQRKLVHKGFESPVVDRVVAELAREGLQSDRRYTEALINSRIGRGQGPLKIRADLSQKAIDDSLVDEVMHELDVDWKSLAADVRYRKFRARAVDSYAEKTRQGRFLSSRGFPGDLIWQVLGAPEE